MSESTIQPAETARNIGVTFDSHHTLKKHISTTCQSIYHYLRKIGYIRPYLSKSTCQKLVQALISSKLDNGNALLYGLPNDHIKPLQHVQNAAAKIIMRARKYDHVTPLLKELHWLPVQDRIKFKLLLMTYKSLNGLAPRYLSDLLHWKTATRTLRSTNKHLLYVPKYKLESYGGRSFSSAAPRLWNELPIEIREQVTISTFKKHLKTYLFSKTF